jgi:tRNA nucleotidyltransferase (CCA-adding enzyme)
LNTLIGQQSKKLLKEGHYFKKDKMFNVADFKKEVPQHIFDISRILLKEGFEAYLVGGSVRDILMGRKPKDYDIGTNALPSDILGIFPKAIATGAQFGSIKVLVHDEKGEPVEVDVTTFRTEEQYIGGRWPSKVEFTRSIEKDLSRRDFTINEIAVHLEKLNKGEESIIDPYGGQLDIQKKLIRAVGNAEERLREDALRCLRACRLASVLGFLIDKEVLEAIPHVLTMIDDLSAERVREELLKILYNSPKPSIGLQLLKDTGILSLWIPELVEGDGVEQPEFHIDDVFHHNLRTADFAEDSVKLPALFHDIAKPRTKKGGHFYRHDVLGSEMTQKIMKRLKFSNKEIERVSTLVRWHMFYFPYDEEDFKKGKRREEVEFHKRRQVGKWSDAAIRRFVRNVGGEEAVDELVKLRIADATANPKGCFDPTEIEALQLRISEVKMKDMILKISDLNVTGSDLKLLGIPEGPRMGEILRDLLEKVIEDPALNDKETLLKFVKNMYIKK